MCKILSADVSTHSHQEHSGVSFSSSLLPSPSLWLPGVFPLCGKHYYIPSHFAAHNLHFVIFFFFLWDRVSLCNSPDFLGTHSVDQADFKFRNPPASAGIKVMSSQWISLKCIFSKSWNGNAVAFLTPLTPVCLHGSTWPFQTRELLLWAELTSSLLPTDLINSRHGHLS